MLPKELTTPKDPNATMRFIENLGEKYGNAIPVFGAAISINPANIDQIVRYLPHIIQNADFYEWHDTLANACRTFCHCLFTDPMLIEAYIGCTFENLVNRIYF